MFFSHFLANCQSVSPVVPGVKGVVKEPAIFQWNVNRGNLSYQVGQLSAFNGTKNDASKLLFSLNVNDISRGGGISNRLNATILGILNTDIKVIYKLKLDNVQYDDVNTTFFLFAIFFGPGGRKESGDVVKLIEVNGTYSFFLCFCFCLALFYSLSEKISIIYVEVVYEKARYFKLVHLAMLNVLLLVHSVIFFW